MTSMQDDIELLRKVHKRQYDNFAELTNPNGHHALGRVLDAIDGGHYQKSHYKPIEGPDPEKKKVVQVTRYRWIGQWKEADSNG